MAAASLAIWVNTYVGVSHIALKTVFQDTSEESSSALPVTQLLHYYTQSCCSRVSCHETPSVPTPHTPTLAPSVTHSGILLVPASKLSAQPVTLKSHAKRQIVFPLLLSIFQTSLFFPVSMQSQHTFQHSNSFLHY